ncbi:Small-conductance mechanosensitive channel [Nitratireductor aquibiodomus]|uniref:Small-conductance mechanosensitive channel n=1 Tax=Nitratireductor aquibiodomus TaxID=204799 RepID=A0A1H4IZI9_9HYPH|nr:mechanosensitive ion channel family protein [Nitratireductor aquibiodomus]SEB39411.1 Small-conductance mechanosensitive channel [Nitratireductor aquibiodomus]
MLLKLRALPVLLCLVFQFAVLAPAAAQGPENFLQTQREKLSGIEATVDRMEKEVDDQAADDGELVAVRVELERLAREVFDASLAFRPRLTEINTRLEQLGEPRKEGEPAEPEEVTRERTRLLDEKASFNVLIGDAERLSVRINSIVDEIAELRRDLFTRTLSRRYDVSAALSSDVAGEFTQEVGRVYKRVSAWLTFVVKYRLNSLLLATALATIAALALLFGGRRLFGDFIEPDPTETEPTYLSRLSLALFSTLIPSLSIGVFLASTYYFLDYFSLLRSDIAPLLWSLFSVILLVYFVYRLARAILAPRRPNWRLLPVRSQAAQWLLVLAVFTAVSTGFDYFMDQVYSLFGSQLSLTVATSLVATVIVGLLIMAIGGVSPLDDEEGRPRQWPLKFRYLLFALGAAIIIAAMLGYIGFARFLSQQAVVTGAIVATMYIGFLTAGAITSEGAFANSWLARRLERYTAFDETALDQLGLVTGMLINTVVVLIGVPLILLQWGFRWADLTAWSYRIAGRIQVGSLSFSIIGILTGILVFVVGYFVTRWFQSWLDGKVMARSRMDSGVRNSIRTGIGYVGLVIAALIGISAAGINLSNLALVAGALSLGIGFGLQNIVSNFVSGLILLAERPFKAGDWIVAGGVSGTVKKISVRATEIETFQRQSVILPNSELINAAVGNWTHRNKLGRMEIPIGVAYGSDVRRVHEILLEIAKSHPLVLKNPEPFVLFAGFGDSSLDFEIRVYLSDILMQLNVQNDIRFAIVDAFEAEGIEIPFPQRDIHVRSGLFRAQEPDETPKDEEPADEMEEEQDEVPAGRRRRRRKVDPE